MITVGLFKEKHCIIVGGAELSENHELFIYVWSGKMSGNEQNYTLLGKTFYPDFYWVLIKLCFFALKSIIEISIHNQDALSRKSDYNFIGEKWQKLSIK